MIFAEKRKAFEKGDKKTWHMDIELFNKNKITYWVEITAKYHQEPGESLKIVGVTRNILERKKTEEQQNDLIVQLKAALKEKELLLKENKILRELLPICSGCKRIRDKDGKWWPLDLYVSQKLKSKLTDTICDDCKKIFYDVPE